MKSGTRWDLSDPQALQAVVRRIHHSYRSLTGDRRTESLEDIVSDCLVLWLEGKRQHSTIDQVVIDVLQRRSGRKGKCKAYELRKALFGAIPYGDLEVDRFKTVQKKTYDFDSKFYMEKICSHIPAQRAKAILKLYYLWGMTMQEIAEVFDITESRILQIIQKQHLKIQQLKAQGVL